MILSHWSLFHWNNIELQKLKTIMKMFHYWHYFDRILFFSCHFNDKTFRICSLWNISLFSSLTTRINSRFLLTNAIFRIYKFNPDEMPFSFFYNIEDLISLVLDHRKPIVHVSNSPAKTYVLARSTGTQQMTPGLSNHFFYWNLSHLFRTRSCNEICSWCWLLRL